MSGPIVPFSEETHAAKYRGEGQSFDEAIYNQSTRLADNEDHRISYHGIIFDMRFLAAGRIQAAFSSDRQVTPYNCFVSGTIMDSFIDGPGSIMDRAKEAAATMRLGGGIGYNFSTLRPRGALIKKLQSQSSGAVSFMGIFNATCLCVASTKQRRGAQMGILRVDHPDIYEFIRVKQNNDQLTGFNLSVAITDEFMECLLEGKSFDLRFEGKVYQTIDPAELWEEIMQSTYDWAEPGVIFIDTINRMNNLWYCEDIVATNPCGEQPLPPHGACLLGSFNLVRYLKPTGQDWPRFEFDYERLETDIPHVVRAVDNVIDRAIYPLPEQEREAKNKRRMGLGVTALANAVEACGYEYGCPKFLEVQEKIFQTLTYGAYRASIELAKEKGSFPLLDRQKFIQSGFMQTMPEDIKQGILEHGIRNSHLISFAPTGTISVSADNVSSGIEPVFAYEYDRQVIPTDGYGAKYTETVYDYGVKFLDIYGKRTADVNIVDHLNVLAIANRYSDSAVSKTCNVPTDISWQDFKDVYVEAWKLGCKGITTYRMGGKRGAVLTVKEEKKDEPAASCYIDPTTGKRDCE